jgi:catechol 2,3-dioxygenase-like lactoylglutathione lyase family enzyme
MTPELPAAVPEIPVSDITAAATYYRDRLSFRLDWVEADIALAGISRDNCRLFLAGAPFRTVRGNVSPVVTWLNLSSKADVDALHQAWRATNAILVSAPESKSWGLHEFTAADPDGNLFRVFYDFATPERERIRSTAVETAPPGA